MELYHIIPFPSCFWNHMLSNYVNIMMDALLHCMTVRTAHSVCGTCLHNIAMGMTVNGMVHVSYLSQGLWYVCAYMWIHCVIISIWMPFRMPSLVRASFFDWFVFGSLAYQVFVVFLGNLSLISVYYQLLMR